MTDKICGYIAIIGRPNVGKSTLINQILAQKISITSRKPQTTRHRILGIHTHEHIQAIFVDTPGIHRANKKALNKVLNRTAKSTLMGVDVILFVIEALQWQEEDQDILQRFEHLDLPIILVINKVDKIKEKANLLPFLQECESKYPFHKTIPISAKNAINITELEQIVYPLLPARQHVFAEDDITDRSMRFLIAEIIREKLMRNTGQEVAYSFAVEIEQYEESSKLIRISALILIEKASHKAIVLGKEGEHMKKIATQARKDIEKLVEKKVFLQSWVKLKENWSDDDRALRSLGYAD